MAFLTRQFDAFNAAAPATKARLIAALCGALGVFCGFVLYVVFTHIFEQGSVSAKLAGVAGGLLASIVIASLAHRLWETIDTGEVKVGWYSQRTLIAVVSLVVVFELSASAFEDFVRALAGDFGAVKRIAADIAGRDEAQAGASFGDEELGLLLARMSGAAKALRPDCVPCAQTPGGRLIALMPRSSALKIFPAELAPSDAEIKTVFFDPFNSMLVGRRQLGNRCAPSSFAQMPAGSLSAALVEGKLVLSPSVVGKTQIDACRASLVGESEERRRQMLGEALKEATARHDLFDAASFKLNADGDAMEVSAALAKKLAWQRGQCDAVRAAGGPADARATCVAVARQVVAAAKDGEPKVAGVLLPVDEMRALNHDLMMAAFPGAVKPLATYWSDFVLLFFVWFTAAVALGIVLANTVFKIAEAEVTAGKRLVMSLGAGVQALLVAAIVSGLAVAAMRVGPYLWQLMFDPASAEVPLSQWFFAAIPWLVRWLADGGIFGIPIPGWVTLPVAVIGTLVAWGRNEDDGLSIFAGFALLGIVLMAIAPVAEGLFGVMALAAGAWFVPVFGLLILLPYLRPGNDLPQWWGIVAVFGGLAVAFWVALFVHDGDGVTRGAVAVAGLVAAGTGVLILRRVPLAELWPLLAITIGLSLLGGTAVFQQLTFAGVLKELHPVSHGVGAKEPDQLEVLRYLYQLRSEHVDDTVPEAFLASTRDEEIKESTRIELALTGSIGFWLTIAMLVAWSLKLGGVAREGAHGSAPHSDSGPADAKKA